MTARVPPEHKILPIEEAKQIEGDGLAEQIRLRREMQAQMVGRLYPSILEDEIQTLLALQRQTNALRNLHKPLLRVKHVDLDRWTPSSEYKSLCPICRAGVLLVARDQATLELIDLDRCTSCAQGFLYEDATIGGEPVTHGAIVGEPVDPGADK